MGGHDVATMLGGHAANSGAAMQNLVPNARFDVYGKKRHGAHLIGRSEGRRHKRQLTGPQEPAAAPAVGEDGVTLPVAANLATPAPGDPGPSTTWDGRDAPSALGVVVEGGRPAKRHCRL